MCPHGLSKPKRHKDYAVDPCILYADLDECDPKTLDIKPTIAIESSPGRYVGYWVTDEPVSESLNRRLTYHIKADVSGWDRSQVLRVPGTTNHKYKSKPKVKILWADGPRYERRRLEKLVPEVTNDKGKPTGGDAQEIYEKYEKHLSRRLRKELINPQVKQGKRSEVLWWMIQELAEAGVTKEEIFIILWDNEWNKHADRRGGERQLEREIDKAVGQHIGGSKKRKKKKTQGDYFKMVSMDTVEAESPQWVVPGMIPRGAITMIDGDPGVGKSYFLQWVCIHLCGGKHLPWDNTHKRLRKLKIAYFDTENAMGVVTRSRLEDNGMTAFENYYQIEEPFAIDDEEAVEAIEEQLIKKHGIDVIIIDPITAYLGATDTNNAKEVKAAFMRINKLAMDHNVAIIIVRHLNKNRSAGALNAGSGSVAFGGTVRMLMTIGWHKTEPNVRVVGCTKTNIAVRFGSLGYSIEPLPDDMGRENRSELIYEGRVDLTSEEILTTTNAKDNDLVPAKELIKEFMEDNGVPYHKLLAQGDKRSISEKSINRASRELDLKKVSRGRGNNRKTYLVENSRQR